MRRPSNTSTNIRTDLDEATATGQKSAATTRRSAADKFGIVGVTCATEQVRGGLQAQKSRRCRRFRVYNRSSVLQKSDDGSRRSSRLVYPRGIAHGRIITLDVDAVFDANGDTG